jgi:hypothetical protein
MPAPLEIKVISVDPVSWTPILVPFDCISMVVKNANATNALKMRTTAGDASTEDTLAPNGEQGLAIPFHRYRFSAGSQPLWLQSAAGTGPVVLKFLA